MKFKHTNAVVDQQLLVHGVKGLRVVDSSIMPRIQNGNLSKNSYSTPLQICRLVVEVVE